jgi:seryl-tRNA synthetase
MLNIKDIQNSFEKIKEGLTKKGVDIDTISSLSSMAIEVKELRKSIEELRAEQNSLSKEFGRYKKEGHDTTQLSQKVNKLKEQINSKNTTLNQKDKELNSIVLTLPNIPDISVPSGVDESENVEIKKILDLPKFDFEPKEHWELAQTNGWIDFARGVKLSKSRFSLLRGDGARVERALISYFLEYNATHGFEEVNVPLIVNKTTMTGTGQLPKFEDDLFKIDGEELYLIPTAEVPLTNIYSDEILSKDELPIKLTAFTPCFRKEAGSAGKDTRGIIRQHQFDKVELVAITTPDKSDEMLDEMVSLASGLLKSLGLAHRVVELCDGDLGFSASKTYDLEVWLPGQNQYREISSISNTREFQARRAKIRFKDGKNNSLVNTLNGSSLAVGRTLVAIMENFQNEDGSINIPSVLQKYL